MYSVPLAFLLRWCFLLTLFFFDEASVLIVIQTNDTLDKIMIRKFLICFWGIFYPQLPVKDEARLCSSTLDESLESRLILTQWNNTSLDGERLEPSFTDGDFQDALLQSWGRSACDLQSQSLSLLKKTKHEQLTRIRRYINTNNSNPASSSDNVDSLRNNGVLNTDALGVDTFKSDTIARTVNTVGLMLHDLFNRVSFTEVNRDGADALGFRKSLRDTINAIDLTGTTKEGGIGTE
jgi:hypothetical protein